MSDTRVLSNGIVERTVVEDGRLWDVREQNVDRLLDWTKHMRDVAPSKSGHAAWRHVGSIPLVVAEQWAAECGAAVGTAEFNEYAKKQLMKGEFAALRVRGA